MNNKLTDAEVAEVQRLAALAQLSEDAKKALRYWDDPTPKEQVKQVTDHINHVVERRLKEIGMVVYLVLLLQLVTLGLLLWKVV